MLQDAQPPNWRHQVLEAALRVTSILMPGVLLALIVSRRGEAIDQFIIVLAVLVCGLIALRQLPQLGFRLRAALFIGTLQAAGIDAIASSGFLPGSGMAALISVALTAVFFGRRAMYLVLVITPIAYLVIGFLVANGYHELRLSDADPMIFRHWVRVASVIGLLSVILGVAIEYVSRQVESGYRSAVDSAVALRTAYDQLGMLHRKLELTKEEERTFLARELHDEMGQTLTVLKLHLQLLFRAATTAAPAQQRELLELVDRLISHVRKISFDLRPTLLDEMGLEPALSAFVEAQARHSGLEIILQMRGFTERFAPELEHACFRLVQEAVTNAMRHAEARRIFVEVRQEQRRLRITIEDDGRGFSAQEAAAKAAAGHLGLVGMRERVRLLGGEFTFTHANPSERPGTRVYVDLPATPPHALTQGQMPQATPP